MVMNEDGGNNNKGNFLCLIGSMSFPSHLIKNNRKHKMNLRNKCCPRCASWWLHWWWLACNETPAQMVRMLEKVTDLQRWHVLHAILTIQLRQFDQQNHYHCPMMRLLLLLLLLGPHWSNPLLISVNHSFCLCFFYLLLFVFCAFCFTLCLANFAFKRFCFSLYFDFKRTKQIFLFHTHNDFTLPFDVFAGLTFPSFFYK